MLHSLVVYTRAEAEARIALLHDLPFDYVDENEDDLVAFLEGTSDTICIEFTGSARARA